MTTSAQMAAGSGLELAARPAIGDVLKIGHRRWARPLVLIAGFPAVLFIAVSALLVLAAWVPVRQPLASIETVPLRYRVVVRGIGLAVAVAGLVALVRDVRQLA